MRRTLTATLCSLVVLVGAVAGGWAASRGGLDRDPVAAAADALPATASEVGVTVWPDLPDSLDEAALRDLTTRSVLVEIADEMTATLGWGPRDLRWEAFASLDAGPVTVARLGDVDAATVARGFDGVGAAGGTDTWDLTGAEGVSDALRTTFSHVRLLRGDGLVVAGDTEVVDETVAAIEGRRRSLLDVRAVQDLAAALEPAGVVLLQSRAVVCQTATTEAPAGLVDPAWAARALDASRPQRLTFAAAFGSPQQARAQRAVREPLSTGTFLGRSGQVEDSLRDPRIDVDAAVLRLAFTLTPEAETFMTDTGPVVFSGCAAPEPA